jgi:hypothetical protein
MLCASPGLQSGERAFKPAERFISQRLGFSPGENAQFCDPNRSRTSHRSHALYQGTTLVGP